MPSKSKFTRDDNGNIAVRVVSNDSSVTNSDSMFTTDENGNVAVRVVYGGGGGGDQHNLGWYSTPEALQEAYPPAEAGDYAIVGSTDTVWIWDTDNSAWVDSDQKGQVTSVNNQTGAVTIKTINNNELVGSGNVELSTYLTYPNTWTTNSTTKAFCDIVAADATATVGKAYLGEVTFSDLPASMVNGEVVVEIMDGTTAANKVIVLSLKSGNVAPYAWQYVYWNGGSNVSGWKTWQEPLESGVNIKTINGNSILGSGDITVSSLPSQTGNAGKFLTTNGTIASWAGAVPQYSTMPTPTSSDNGKIVQYVGATDANYTNGYFYKGAVAQSPAQYTVTSINVSGSTIQEEDITDYYPNGVTVSFNEAGLSSFLQSYGYTLEDLGNTFYITIADYQVEYENDDPENPETIVETYESVSIAGGTVSIFAADNNDAILSQIGYTCSESFDDSAFSPMGTATGVDYGLGINYVPSSNVSEWANIDVQNTPDPLPSQTGNNGKFLTTNGTVASWGAVESLPSQTGNAGKFLTTDGTDASWSDKPLENLSTYGLIIYGNVTSDSGNSVVLGGKGSGYGATSSDTYNVVIGPAAKSASRGVVVVGYDAQVTASSNGATVVGNSAKATQYGIAIGADAIVSGKRAIQLGGGTNSVANTLKVGLSSSDNYTLLEADGTIPTDRFTTTPSADGTYVPTLTISSGTATRSWTTPASAPVVPATMPTLAVNDWSSNTQTVNVTGVTASNVVFVSPAPASASDYASAGIVCTAQGAGTLTFTCTTVPSNAITVNVVILG